MTGIPRFSGVVAANTAASIKAGRRSGHSVCIGNVAWSYSAAPTGGSLDIIDTQGVREYQVDITAAGFGGVLTGGAWAEFESNADVTLTLAAGGAAVVGKLSCIVWYKPVAQ